MKYSLSFLLGAFVGAAVALLLAPSSGEETASEHQVPGRYPVCKDARPMAERHAGNADPHG